MIGTAYEFLVKRNGDRSSYDKFRSRLAFLLGTAASSVDVFSVVDASAEGSVDVRFTAHGSPYYNSTKLIGAVLSDAEVSIPTCHTVAGVSTMSVLRTTSALRTTSVGFPTVFVVWQFNWFGAGAGASGRVCEGGV